MDVVLTAGGHAAGSSGGRGGALDCLARHTMSKAGESTTWHECSVLLGSAARRGGSLIKAGFGPPAFIMEALINYYHIRSEFLK